MNGTHAPDINAATPKRDYTCLQWLEGSLRRPRVAIRDAKLGNRSQDSNYTPHGPMYWNANAFHRYIPLVQYCVT